MFCEFLFADIRTRSGGRRQMVTCTGGVPYTTKATTVWQWCANQEQRSLQGHMTTATQQERVLPRRPRLQRNAKRKQWRIPTSLHLQSQKISCMVSAPNSVIPCEYSTPQTVQ